MPKVVEVPGVGNVEFPDSMDDEAIGTAIRKMPGMQQPDQHTGIIDKAMKTLGAWWGDVNPITQLQGMAAATSQPLDAARGMLAAQGQLALDAKESFERGDYVKGLRQSLHYLMPVFGPGNEAAAQEFDKGNTAEGFGKTTAIGTNLVLPMALERIPSVNVGGIFKSRLNPVEQGAIDYVRSEGVPVRADVQTGNKILKAVEPIVARTPLGAPVSAASEAATVRELRNTAGRLESQIHPTPVSPELAGGDVRRALTSRAEGFRQQADAAYTPFHDAHNDPANLRTVQTRVGQGNPSIAEVPLPVDITDIKAQVKPIYDHIIRTWDKARQNGSTGLRAVEAILKDDDVIPASIAETNLSGLKELAREDSGRSGAMARFVLPKLQSSVDKAVGAIDQKLLTNLQEGRRFTALQKGTEAVLKPLRDEPVQAFGQLKYGQDAGIEQLRSVLKEVPGEAPKIGRAIVEELFDTATEEGGFSKNRTLLSKWQKLGPETKKLLFPNPVLRQNLDKFFLAQKLIADNPNPSGSALVGWVAGQGAGLHYAIANPVAGTSYVLGGGAIAKLLHSPGGADLLIRGMQMPLGRSAAAASLYSQIMAKAGEQAEKARTAARDLIPAAPTPQYAPAPSQ